ncbi:MAG: hypothetical protein WBC91_02295 [Phototrophicaceae bacterium]
MSDAEAQNEKKYLLDKKEIIDQSVLGYGREIELVEFNCACPNCPYCHNEMLWSHPNRVYCDPEAMLLHRQRIRNLEAIADGRTPGKRGRPSKNPVINIIYMFQASESNFYKIGWTVDSESYQKVFENNQDAIPKGITEVFMSERASGQAVVEALYDIYGQQVINNKWLELSEEQAQAIKSLFIKED